MVFKMNSEIWESNHIYYFSAGDTLHIMKELRTMLLRLKGEFMSEDGSSVDYFSMGKSESFQNYKELAAGLRYI